MSKLKQFVEHQIRSCSDPGAVELIVDVDDKEVSIGTKRNRMYQACTGLYAVQIDDDDWVHDRYVQLILDVIDRYEPDCIGYKESCILDGRAFVSGIGLRYGSWKTLTEEDPEGLSFYRTPFMKTPIKSDICRRVGVKNMRFGEDYDFSTRLYPHLASEHFIDEVMYFYSARTLTLAEHNARYGIGPA